MGIHVVRGAMAFLGLLLLLAGAGLVAVAGPAGLLAGAMLFVAGAVLLVAVAVERMRYRAEAVEGVAGPVGPGGGEPLDRPLEARFEPTPEVFLDPTTHQRMRVHMDRRTGERRYVAEG